MYLDTDQLAEKLYNRSLNAYEVPIISISRMLARANPGHPTIDEPEQYRWFVIEHFPTKDLEVTLEHLLEEAGSAAGQEKWQHDRIVDLLVSGAPEWPAFVTADGIIVDGYHRIAAHRTLKDLEMDIVVSVRKPGREITYWDNIWNEVFPIRLAFPA